MTVPLQVANAKNKAKANAICHITYTVSLRLARSHTFTIHQYEMFLHISNWSIMNMCPCNYTCL